MNFLHSKLDTFKIFDEKLVIRYLRLHVYDPITRTISLSLCLSLCYSKIKKFSDTHTIVAETRARVIAKQTNQTAITKRQSSMLVCIVRDTRGFISLLININIQIDILMGRAW